MRWDASCLTIAADPKHAQQIVRDLGLETCNVTKTPEKTRDAQIKTLSCVVIWRMVLVLAFESTSASTNQGQSSI